MVNARILVSDVDSRNRACLDATSRNDPDEIILAYLDLASTLVHARRLDVAASELEAAITLLAAVAPGARDVWRLHLTLAAMYVGLGDRPRAQLSVDAAREQAMWSGSGVGVERARELAARIARRPARGTRRHATGSSK